MYLLAHCDEDGDVTIDYLATNLLESRLDENYYGIESFLDPADTAYSPDPQAWPRGSALVVEVKSVVVPVQAVTAWRLP